MKTLIVILISMMLAVSFSISAESEGHAMGGCQDGQMMEMMKVHMMSMQMMNGGMMEGHSTENSEEHVH
jgi:hypothetical protein